MKRHIFLLSLVVTIFLYGQIKNKGSLEAIKKTDRQFFIENKGQWPEEVKFMTRMKGCIVWVTTDGMVLDYYRIEGNETDDKINSRDFKRDDGKLRRHVVKLEWIGCNNNSKAEGKKKKEGYYNYFIGNDSAKWVKNVSLFEEVMIKGIYPGVDVRYYFDKGYPRFDFLLEPGAEPSVIKWKFYGTNDEEVVENNLKYQTRFGWAEIGDLKSYQDDKEISINFKKEGDTWTLVPGDYDKNEKLLIDPLVYSTFLGGNGEERCVSLTVDNNGNAYVTGWTYSPDFPVSTGSYDVSFGGQRDIFVTKLNPSGTGLIYSTFIGGSGYDEASSITIDDYGNVFIAGGTDSDNYPVTTGAYDVSYNFNFDVIVTKLNSFGNALLISTYVGGNSVDYAYSMTVDGGGNMYLTGTTYSTNYPVTSGAYDLTHNGDRDVFVTRLNANGNSLVYSTFIGGSNAEEALSIKIDGYGNAYITGITFSSNFPATTGAFDVSFNGVTDAFVTKLNSTGNALIYSTYIGGDDYDYAYSIAVDNGGNAYITGGTLSTNYPTTLLAYDVSCNGSVDGFITKLNPSGSGLLYSTFLGGSTDDNFYSLFLDGGGNVYVAGSAYSTNFPTTSDAYDDSHNGERDVIVAKLNPSGNNLLYSTYIGGTGSDVAYAIYLDNNSNIYVAGRADSASYPTTPGAFDEAISSFTDGFVTKLCVQFSTITLTSGISTDSQTLCINTPITNITYSATNATGAVFNGLPPGVSGAWNGGIITISGTPIEAGTYNYTITLTGGCGNTSATGSITVEPENTITITSGMGSQVQDVCVNTPMMDVTYVTTGATGATFAGLPPGVNGVWNNGNITISGTPTVVGYYSYTITLTGGCGNVTSTGDLVVHLCDGVDENNDHMLDVYPNPTTGDLFVKWLPDLKPDGDLNIEIIDFTGKIVYTETHCRFDKEVKISLNHLTPGVYYLRLKLEEILFIYKIIRQNK